MVEEESKTHRLDAQHTFVVATSPTPKRLMEECKNLGLSSAEFFADGSFTVKMNPILTEKFQLIPLPRNCNSRPKAHFTMAPTLRPTLRA